MKPLFTSAPLPHRDAALWDLSHHAQEQCHHRVVGDRLVQHSRRIGDDDPVPRGRGKIDRIDANPQREMIFKPAACGDPNTAAVKLVHAGHHRVDTGKLWQ